jgi:ferredoxin
MAKFKVVLEREECIACESCVESCPEKDIIGSVACFSVGKETALFGRDHWSHRMLLYYSP